MDFWWGFCAGCVIGTFAGILIVGVCALIRAGREEIDNRIARRLWRDE